MNIIVGIHIEDRFIISVTILTNIKNIFQIKMWCLDIYIRCCFVTCVILLQKFIMSGKIKFSSSGVSIEDWGRGRTKDNNLNLEMFPHGITLTLTFPLSWSYLHPLGHDHTYIPFVMAHYVELFGKNCWKYPLQIHLLHVRLMVQNPLLNWQIVE